MTYRQMKRQPRAKAMLPEIKELIVMRAIGSIEKDRNLLAEELREEIKNKFPQELPPTKTTLVKKISEARNHATDPLDQPFHLGILDKLPSLGIPYISGDEIGAIIKIRHWLYQEQQDLLRSNWGKKNKVNPLSTSTFIFHTLSVRQAKWIAALHRIKGEDSEILWHTSLYYAYKEVLSNICDIPFDTWQTDLLLLRLKGNEFLKHLSMLIDADKNYYGDDFEKAFKTLSRVRFSPKPISEEDFVRAIMDYKEKENAKDGKQIEVTEEELKTSFKEYQNRMKNNKGENS